MSCRTNTCQRFVTKMEDDGDLTGAIITQLNRDIPTINDLEKAADLLKAVKAKQQSILRQLAPAAGSESDHGTHVLNLHASLDGLEMDLNKQWTLSTEVLKGVQERVEAVQELNHCHEYLKSLTIINECCSRIEASEEDQGRAIEAFIALRSIDHHISDSMCNNLKQFVKELVIHFYSRLKDELKKDLEASLKVLQWPKIVVNTKALQKPDPVLAAEHLEILKRVFLQLASLGDDPNDCNKPNRLQSQSLAPENSLVLPIEIMLEPLKKRFVYHFYGNRPTNVIGKPEWFLTQILNWITQHKRFLLENVQPLMKETSRPRLNVYFEFCRGLCQLVADKLLADLPQLLADDSLFSHAADELLSFCRELPANFLTQTPLAVILQLPQPKARLLQLQKQVAQEKIDELLGSEEAWLQQFTDLPEANERKLPTCTEAFITLMETINERWRVVPSAEHRVPFAELQLQLLDDFRLRLVQLRSTHAQLSGCALLNSVAALIELLTDWQLLPEFLLLQTAKNKERRESHKESDESLSAVLLNLQHLRSDLQQQLVRTVCQKLQPPLVAFAQQKWLLPAAGVALLSTGACGYLQTLQTELLYLQGALSAAEFSRVWPLIATTVNQHILDSVILPNHFNEAGGEQISCDVNKYLLPLFSHYTSRPEAYFRHAREAAVLLCMSRGTALLLRDTLYESLHGVEKPGVTLEDPVAALSELGVKTLSLEQAEHVVRLRTDLSIT